jgi:hypothetical protein
MTWRPSVSRRDFRVKDAAKRRADLLRLLDVERCPLCVVAAKEEESWFEWYRIEKAAEPQMVMHLRDSHGFCPQHTRAFGIDRATNHFLTSMLADVTRHGLVAPASKQCPTCDAVRGATERESQRLVRELDDPPIAVAYAASAGLCAPHAWAALAYASPSVAGRIVAKLHEHLDARPELEMVAGHDTDAEVRATLLAASHKTLESEVQQFVALDPIERLETELTTPACPACRAVERGVVAYFGFLGDESTHPTRSAEVAQLCAPHLHDLAHFDERAGSWAIAAVAKRLDLDLLSYEEVVQWNVLSLRTRAQRVWKAAPLRWRAPARTLRQAQRRATPARSQRRLVSDWECQACRAGEVLSRRVLALFRAAAGEPRVDQSLAASYGFCLRHAADVPGAMAVLRRRLATEQWALDEATRKIAWDTRYESKGLEYEAWRATVGHYDGATYLGLSVDEVAQRIADDDNHKEQ